MVSEVPVLSLRICSMPETVIPCSIPGCREPALYKVAAPWSGGGFSELKTYAFACPQHLGATFRAAEERRARYCPAAGESVGEIAIYRYEAGRQHAWQLQRISELEVHNRSWGSGMEGV
jgi:hypothetical protein